MHPSWVPVLDPERDTLSDLGAFLRGETAEGHRWLPFGENILRDLRDKLMAHLLTQPLSFFHARRHGSLISRMISDIEAMRNGIHNNFFISFVSLGQLACAAALRHSTTFWCWELCSCWEV